VASYSTSTAVLALAHDHPRGNRVCVSVCVKLLLQSIGAEQTDIGQWVNVIGYVTSIGPSSVVAPHTTPVQHVGVQALVLWTAKDLDMSSYEGTFTSDKG
jgi:hypothetical protein